MVVRDGPEGRDISERTRYDGMSPVTLQVHSPSSDPCVVFFADGQAIAWQRVRSIVTEGNYVKVMCGDLFTITED